jgi:hypothetical protein
MLTILMHRRIGVVITTILRNLGCCLLGRATRPVNLSNHKPMPYQTSGTKGIDAKIALLSLVAGKAILNGTLISKAGRLREAATFIATGIGLGTSHTNGGPESTG